jgi:hypothetical protein
VYLLAVLISNKVASRGTSVCCKGHTVLNYWLIESRDESTYLEDQSANSRSRLHGGDIGLHTHAFVVG